jgi:hypothetical protein
MPSSDPRVAAAPHVGYRLGAAAALPLALLASLLAAATALAESPSPTQAAVGDPRSSGSGPGLVGDPLFAIGIVVIIALVALGATLVYVRATGGRRSA